MVLDISSEVSVSDVITPLGLLRRVFGISFLLTTDTILGTGSNRIAVLTSTDDASDIWSSGDEPYEAAAIYFQQVPYPKNMVVGRWIDADVGADITGDDAALLAAFTAISDGSFQMNAEDLTGINMSGDSSLTEVAATIETVVQAATDTNLTTATVTYDAVLSAFVIATVTTGATAVLTIASAAASGTDISALLGMATADAYVLNQGKDEETITEAIEACLALNDSPYFITLDETITGDADKELVRAWVESRRYMYFASDDTAGTVTPGETSSIFYDFSQLAPPRTFGLWSATLDYKVLSAAGRLGSFNPEKSNDIITLNKKQLPGTVSDSAITATQKAELDAKLVNYYVPLFSESSSGADALLLGSTFDLGVWADVRFWLDWLVNALQVDVFNFLYGSKRVPQTEAGVTALISVIEGPLKQGVNNGGLAPGTLSAINILDVQQTTGNLDFDGYLPKGYLIYVEPIALQSTSSREAREAPPTSIWCKGSGAIHTADISLVFEN